MFYRIHDCWNRPLAGPPDAYVDVVDRTPPRGQAPLALTGTTTRCLNLGSYNYLGFAAADEYCTPRVLATLDSDGWSPCAARPDGGTSPVLAQLEKEVAAFLGVDAAAVFGMGFATNAAVLPALDTPPGAKVLQLEALRTSLRAQDAAGGAARGPPSPAYGASDCRS